MENFIEIAKVFGLPVALLVFFIWRDYMRSKRDEKTQDAMTARLQAAEDFQKNELQNLAVENRDVVVKNTAAIEQHTETMKGFSRALLRRPCMAEEDDNG